MSRHRDVWERYLQPAPARSRALLLAFLVLLALGLRLARLEFQPLWWDEGYSVWFATHPLSQMLALTAQDIHPPLYYALLSGWISVFGAGPAALRLFSALLGTLAVPAIFLAGRRLLDRRAALLAALLLTINPLHIYYSQEVRMYGLVALLSAGTLAAAWPLFARPAPHSSPGRPATLRFVPYVLLVTAALYTQYYAVFLPVGLTLYAIWRWRHSLRALAGWLVAQAVCALLYLPWLIYATPRLIPYVGQKVVADADRPLALLPYVAQHLSAFIAGHLEGRLLAWWPLALLWLVPVVAGLVLGLRGRGAAAPLAASPSMEEAVHVGNRIQVRLAASAGLSANGQGDTTVRPGRAPILPGSGGALHNAPAQAALLLLAMVLLAALALGYAISRRFPFFPERGERLLLLALPPFILLAAAGLSALWRRSPVAGILAVGLAGGLAGVSLAGFYTIPRYAGDDYRPLIARIVEQGLPEDTIFCVYPWQAGYWRSYGDPAGPQAILTPSPAWGQPVATVLDAALARGHVWFPGHLALGAILETQIENYVAGQARPFANQWYGPGTRLSGWAAAAQAEGASEAPVVTFTLPGGDHDLFLDRVRASPDPVQAANAVAPLTLSWRAGSTPPDLGVSVRLVDDLGQVWAQNDYEPLGGAAIAAAGRNLPATTGGAWQAEDRLGLLVPAGTPPGAYHVQIIVRLANGDQPLAAIVKGGVRQSGPVSLYALTVTPAGRSLGVERLPVAQRATTAMGDGLSFLGYSTSDKPGVPGELRKLSLFWRATGRPTADYTAFVQLLGQPGRPPIAGWEAAPGAAYATDQWTPGTLIRTQASFRLPADLPDGQYRLIAGLFGKADGRRLRLETGGTDYLALGAVTVRGRQHNMIPPGMTYQEDVRPSDFSRLAGYDLPDGAQASAGGALAVTLYWQSMATPPQPYTVFVHLLDPAGNLRGAGDGEPGQGTLPVTGWLPGEYLADRHAIAVDAGAPPGTYQVAIGWYDPATGRRLTTDSGAEQVILPTAIVIK